MPELLDFASPPIVELVLGAQFSPLTRLTLGHFGWFWKQLGDEWTEPSDGPQIEDQFELFDRPPWSQPAGPILQGGSLFQNAERLQELGHLRRVAP